MKKALAMFACLCTLLIVPALSSAGGVPELLAVMQDTRAKLLALVDSTDQAVQAGLIADLMKSHGDIDQRIAALGAGSDDVAKEKMSKFKPIWDSFKETREKEIFPALQVGDKAKAQSIGKGVQAGRFQQMIEILK
ncbi:MAG: hypothetical protein HQL91_08470 [Magnetococcales bacterium]|nr:hypothetical protein [Magnetococcales bacterium]